MDNPCPDDLPLPVSAHPTGAAWIWLALIITVIAFEWWAVRTKHQTLSQWLGKWSHRFPWVKWLAAGVLAYAWWHWFVT